MLDYSLYPKTGQLHGGREISIVPLQRIEHPDVIGFIRKLPGDERNLLWDDLTDPTVYQRLIAPDVQPQVVALAGLIGGKVVTVWTLTGSEHAWTKHLGTIWGIVDPAFRKFGVGAVLVKELLHFAGQLDMERVVLELVRPQKGPIGHFSKVGFEVAATLQDWVKDHSNRYHDLLVLTMKLEPAWRKMDEMLSRYDAYSD